MLRIRHKASPAPPCAAARREVETKQEIPPTICGGGESVNISELQTSQQSMSKQIGVCAGACKKSVNSVSRRKVLVIRMVYIAQIPNDLNISADEAKVSTRPARMSSCESW